MKRLIIPLLLIFSVTTVLAEIYEWSNGVPISTDNTNYEWSNGVPYIITNGTIPAAPEDTCTCAGLNENWEIDLSDYCQISTNCNLGTGTLSFTGTGAVFIDAIINTTGLGSPPANEIVWINNSGVINEY